MLGAVDPRCGRRPVRRARQPARRPPRRRSSPPGSSTSGCTRRPRPPPASTPRSPPSTGGGSCRHRRSATRPFIDAPTARQVIPPAAGPIRDLPRRPRRAPPPLPAEDRVLAALGPKMLELARDRSAGSHPYLVTPEHTAIAREALGAGPLLAPEQAVVLETDPDTRPERSPARTSSMYPASQLRQQLEAHRLHRRRHRRRRQRPPGRRAGRLGRRGRHRRSGAGPPRRRRRPRLRAAAGRPGHAGRPRRLAPPRPGPPRLREPGGAALAGRRQDQEKRKRVTSAGKSNQAIAFTGVKRTRPPEASPSQASGSGS